MDVDGKMVLLYAASGGLVAKPFNDSMTETGDTIALPNTSMEGWTEGPDNVVIPHVHRIQIGTEHDAAVPESVPIRVGAKRNVSDKATENAFTAEYNVKGEGKMVFSYTDADNYGYMSFDGRNVSVRRVSGGATL